MKVYNVNMLAHKELVSTSSGEIFSKSAVLTEILGHQDIFIHHEILLPGRRSSSPHSHTHREEIIFVLKGSPTIHLGDQGIQLQPEDFIGFEPGSTQLHFIENATTEEVRFLVICSNPENDQVVFG